MKPLIARQELVGRLVREELARRGMYIAAAKRQWKDYINPSTLRRLIEHGRVNPMFYVVVEKRLDWPELFLSMVAAGNVAGIRALPGLPERLRDRVLLELENDNDDDNGDDEREARRTM